MGKIKIIPLAAISLITVIACSSPSTTTSKMGKSVSALGTIPAVEQTITVDFNGGTYQSESTLTINVRKGTLWKYAKEKLPKGEDIVYEYHTFKQYLIDGEEILDSYVVSNDIDVVASYIINEEAKHTITWKNGETQLDQEIYSTGEIPTYKKEEPTEPTDPISDHIYEFNGWNPTPSELTTVDTDITYVAQFKDVTEIEVTFDYNYDNFTTSTTVIYNSQLSAPTTPPTRTGFTFLGWFDEKVEGNEITFPITITSTTTLYAHWSQITIDVKFDESFDHSGRYTTKTVNYGSKVIPYIPLLTGYVFDKWVIHGTTTEFDFDTEITAAITLDAIYTTATPDTCTVYFASNGGSAVNKITVEYNTKIKVEDRPAPPTRGDAFTFKGWFKEEALTNEFVFDNEFVTSSIVLYAKWEQKTFTINFKDLDVSTTTYATKTVKYGEILPIITNPTRTHYNFDGWYDSTGNTPYDFTQPVTSNFDVFAKWSVIKCTVTYASNGGSSIAPGVVNEGSTVTTKPTDPTKTGYTFAGWYTDDVTFSNPFNFGASGTGTTVNSNITIYAKWTINTYTVRFLDEDTSITTPYASLTINYGEKVGRIKNPIKSSKVFLDWYTDRGHTSLYNFDNPVTSNFDLYAHWENSKCVVIYNSKCDTTISPVEVPYNGTITTPPTAPTKDHYEFGGWYTDDETFENEFKFGASGTGTPVTTNIVLHAKWIATEVKVNWMAADNTTVLASNYCAIGTSPTMPEDLTLPSKATTTTHRYVFDGWINDMFPVTKETDIFPSFINDDYITIRFKGYGYTIYGQSEYETTFKFNQTFVLQFDIAAGFPESIEINIDGQTKDSHGFYNASSGVFTYNNAIEGADVEDRIIELEA